MGRRVLVSVFVFSLFFAAGSAQAATHSHILSFKIWKQKKIDEAKAVVNELKREQKKTSVKTEDDEEASLITTKMTQASLNLGVAKELSANDYFVLYVAPQFKDNTEALREAAKKLSPKDVADILSAYQKSLQAPVQPAGSGLAVDPPSEGTSVESPTL